MSLREAAEMALECLEFFRDTAMCDADTNTALEGIAALRDALAEAAKAEKAEPVARVVEVGNTTTPEGRLATIIAEALGVDHPAMTDFATILLRRAHPPAALPDDEVLWECEENDGRRVRWSGVAWLSPGDAVVVRRAAARGKG